MEYNLLFQYRSIGDAIAFTFIDRHDIKPQAEKELAGFISCKKGNRAKREALRMVFKSGGIAILMTSRIISFFLPHYHTRL